MYLTVVMLCVPCVDARDVRIVVKVVYCVMSCWANVGFCGSTLKYVKHLAQPYLQMGGAHV